MKEEYIQVLTTTEKKKGAEEIAKILVEKKIAACVQIFGPIISTYWWKEKIEKTEEWLCFIKTKKNLYAEVEKTIKEIHPYDVPEIIALPIISGSKEYLEWLNSALLKRGIKI